MEECEVVVGQPKLAGGDVLFQVCQGAAEAIDQLNGRGGTSSRTGAREEAPPGFDKVAVLYLEPDSPEPELDEAGLVRFLHRRGRLPRVAEVLCAGGVAQLTELVIVNASGIHRWTSDRLRELSDACP
ncbi:hypothetical protein [Plantactinospora sp. GCM10030261]|uniref:hypothetical protein n=1 Tax=Plantactinospora sp. GCM10030261 TaxID=3273420 RepID=UPI00360EB2FD